MSDSLVHATSGAAGGIVAMAITYPLINISTRAQVETTKHPNETLLDAVRKVLRKEGILGLYDGLSSSLLGIAVTNGIYYLFFEETRAILLRAKMAAAKSTNSKGNVKATLSTLESIFASFIAGCATSIISNPIWVINTRQTVSTSLESSESLPLTSTKSSSSSSSQSRGKAQQKRPKLGFIATLLHILRTDGWPALFHGLGPALILVINPILQYTLFEQLKNALLARRAARLTSVPRSATELPPPIPLGDWDFFWLGAVSKLFATGITYPYLTVKSRMQSGQREGRTYTSSWDGVKRIVKKEGPEGLYRGIGTKLTQSVLTAAILFMSKEKIYLATKKALSTAADAAQAI